MQTTIIQRVRAIIDYLGVSDNRFAKTIGVPQATISNLFNRNSDVKSVVLGAIVSAYGIISARWLLTGQGSMLNDEASPSTPSDEVAKLNAEIERLNAVVADLSATLRALTNK